MTDKPNAIDTRMRELNDLVDKAHADLEEFRKRTEFYRNAEECCDGFREAFVLGGMKVIVRGVDRHQETFLECPETLAECLWLVLRDWQETEKRNLTKELEASPEPTRPDEAERRPHDYSRI